MAGEPQRFEFESKHMGTVFRIVFYAADRPTAEAAAKAAFARVAEIDKALSDYDPDSELMRLCRANDAAPGKPIAVGSDLFFVLRKAQGLSQRSEGAFDVTVGPLVRLWRLARRTQQLPDAKELADARLKVGYDKVFVHDDPRMVALSVAGMRLDFGGIAKGYAADAALGVLAQKFGIKQALVAAAGDIACGDPPPGKDGWAVDIAPIAKGREPRRLMLANRAVSTSGDLEQFVEINGVRYSHVLDPKTGLGLTGRRSVTLIARRGVDADSLTKAVSVLPPEKALALVESLDDAGAYIVVKERDDAAERTTASQRFAGYLAK